jgi:diacylglycerol kinase family enzyme
MEIAVLHNPTAGDRELSRRGLIALLRGAGYRPEYFSFKEKAWKEPDALLGSEFVVVAGGDGSVKKAVLELHDRGLPLAFLPLGTANNICACLGIVGKPRQIIRSWSRARREWLDIGVARGPWGKRLFVESVGAGLIGRAINIMAAVGAMTEHRLERREDRVHRDSTVVLALAHELHPVRLSVSADGRRAITDDYLLLEVMNIGRAGPGLELAPRADPTDGKFDFVTATANEQEKLIRALASTLENGKAKSTLARGKIRTLRLELSAGEIRIDDQVAWSRPRDDRRSPKKRVSVEIAMRHSAVEILLPHL